MLLLLQDMELMNQTLYAKITGSLKIHGVLDGEKKASSDYAEKIINQKWEHAILGRNL